MTAPLEIQRSAAALEPGTAACMGAFDGLHRGHRALIDRAAAVGSRVALVTFDPHPMQVLAPERAPKLLHTPELRARAAASLGVRTLVLLPFDREMSRLSPDAFVRRYLVDGLRPAALVIGRDFRFGAGRAGDASMLERLLEPHGIAVHTVDPVTAGGPDAVAKLSSTDIRVAVDAGEMDRSAELLGRFHSVHGPVVHGAKRGRTIGFPTANVACAGAYLPPPGVYATFTTMWSPDSPDYGTTWPSVTNVGRNPTFNAEGAPLTVESHVLGEDLAERLYGFELDVAFVERIRGEVKFEGPAALVAQIERDADAARTILAERIDQGQMDGPSPMVLRPVSAPESDRP